MKNQPVFDPSVLERAAKALREINSSPHAQKALDAMIKAEEAKQADSKAIQKKYELNKVKAEGEERRRNIDHQKDVSQQLSDYNDKLERQRIKDKLKEKELTSEKLRLEQEESVRRQENMRRETMNMQMKKQFELEEKKIILQSKLNQENYRKNFDLILQEQEKKLQFERQSKLETHNLYLQKFQEGFKYLQYNPDALVTVGKTMLFISGGYFFSKYSLGLGFRILEAFLAKPSLVRETSRRSLKWMMPSSKKIFDKIVLNSELEQTLKLITAGFIAKQTQSVPLRNFLFHGQPGTGKTLFAKLLAYNSGMHFAVISGGDIEKLGQQAVPQIDKLFNWCQSTPKGTLIFIDEAEAIFYKRSQSQKTSAALSTFLAQTSSASKKYSLILATNLPNKLDEAILDRIDQIVQFEYLNQEQRIKLLKKGFEQTKRRWGLLQYIINPSKIFQKQFIITQSLTENDFEKLSQQLDHFSPRQIDKFILSIHDAALGECILQRQNQFDINIDFATNILQRSVKENDCRQSWSSQI